MLKPLYRWWHKQVIIVAVNAAIYVRGEKRSFRHRLTLLTASCKRAAHHRQSKLSMLACCSSFALTSLTAVPATSGGRCAQEAGSQSQGSSYGWHSHLTRLAQTSASNSTPRPWHHAQKVTACMSDLCARCLVGTQHSTGSVNI